MNTPGIPAVSLAWTSVYTGLALFFLVVAPRFRGRGYELLGIAMAGVAVASLGTWLTLISGPTTAAVVGGRLLILGATFAPAFNTHFLLRFTRWASVERWVFIGYALAGATCLADIVAAFTLPVSPLARPFPAAFISPSPLLAVVISVLFGLHLALGAGALGLAIRRGMATARLPFVLLAGLGPAVVIDFSSVLRDGHNYYITEGLTWVYALVIVTSLLSELRGTEGLLARTTSSLAERTAELQVSYAELELVHSELSKKEQLAAVGELAASIAHEVRNPLAIIMNAASGLRRKTLSEQDKATLLSIVDEESARLNQLVTELLRFSRPVEAARAPASLLDICKQVQDAAPEGYEIQIEHSDDSGVDTVLVDSGLFRLALDNLLLNAQQALPSGGVIVLALGRTTLSDGGAGVFVEVRDAGQGMVPEDLERARKPFFTTRPRGTGLGLPIVDRILEAHGGEVSLVSQLGLGTTVTLKLPHDLEEPPTAGRYPGSKTPSQRRRMRSFPNLGSDPGAPPSGHDAVADSTRGEAPPPPSFPKTL